MSFPRSLGLGLVALAVAACSFVETTPPAPTPADWPDTAIELVQHGIVIGNQEIQPQLLKAHKAVKA